MREFHISYFCQEQSKQKQCAEKFKKFENFGKELCITSKTNTPNLVQRTSRDYNIIFKRENSADVNYKSIKLEMIAKNGLKKPINFSATKYFTSRNKKILSYMEYIQQKQKENKQMDTTQVKKPAKKPVKKRESKLVWKEKKEHSEKQTLIR